MLKKNESPTANTAFYKVKFGLNKVFTSLSDDFKLERPQGGMFSWFTIPEGFSSIKIFEAAAKRKVTFVPGVPFYLDKSDTNICSIVMKSITGFDSSGQLFY